MVTNCIVHRKLFNCISNLICFCRTCILNTVFSCICRAEYNYGNPCTAERLIIQLRFWWTVFLVTFLIFCMLLFPGTVIYIEVITWWNKRTITQAYILYKQMYILTYIYTGTYIHTDTDSQTDGERGQAYPLSTPLTGCNNGVDWITLRGGIAWKSQSHSFLIARLSM